MDIKIAKKIMVKNFIGPDELDTISDFLNINKIDSNNIPTIPFSESILKNNKNSILALGVNNYKDGGAVTLNSLRSLFGVDPSKKEPCFYNQDWYLSQSFANKGLEMKWYLINKDIKVGTRGEEPGKIINTLDKTESLPKAVVTAFVFFANYLINKEILWKEDFIWCSDLDDNGDRIYVGRYVDPLGKNKNGFNIHRHLRIRPCYGVVTEIL